MTRRRRTRDDMSPHRWVVSYADFITLLLAFFVVMYSISSVNEGKYRALSQALEGIFQGTDYTFDPLQLGDVQERDDRRDIGLIDQRPQAGATQLPSDASEQQSTELQHIENQAVTKFKELIADGDLSVSSNRLWLEIEIQSSLLFASGSAQPSMDAYPVLEAVATLLAPYENPIHVEGFTDDQPISSDLFPSNWELSAARAAGVVRVLSHYGVGPERMAAVGYGEFQPKVSNLTPRGRSKNRRVKIVVSRDEKVQRTLSAMGSGAVSDETVNAILEAGTEQNTAPSQGSVEAIETPQGVIFTQGEEGAADPFAGEAAVDDAAETPSSTPANAENNDSGP